MKKADDFFFNLSCNLPHQHSQKSPKSERPCVSEDMQPRAGGVVSHFGREARLVLEFSRFLLWVKTLSWKMVWIFW
jgi:hypothetical protein